MNWNFMNSLIFLGILQSCIMSILIIRTRSWKQLHNKLLLAIIIALGCSLLPAFIGNSKLVLIHEQLRFIPLSLTLFIFPLLFLYFKSIFEKHFNVTKSTLRHFIVPILFWVYTLVIWIVTLFYPVDKKGIIATSVGYSEVQVLGEIIFFLMAVCYSWASYVLLKSAKKNNLPNRKMKYVNSFTYLLVFLLIGVILEYTSILLGHIYGYWRSSPVDEWFGFSFTLLVKVYNAILAYMISLIGYISYATYKRDQNTKNDIDYNTYISKIRKVMKDKKLYLNTTLSLPSMAKEVAISPSVLSKILNTHLDTSFNDFVNGYRVEAVKEKLHSDTHNQYTLLAIAQSCGFKSKTTFYRAFQKATSLTPKAYLKNLERSE